MDRQQRNASWKLNNQCLAGVDKFWTRIPGLPAGCRQPAGNLLYRLVRKGFGNLLASWRGQIRSPVVISGHWQ
jgi:hypothetical protein